MKQKILFWTISIVLTIFLAIYQRVTGPTYPTSGKFQLDGETYKYSLPRSSDGAEHTYVRLDIKDPSVSAKVVWKRFKTNDEFSEINMTVNEGKLEAELPKQPSAGKLLYEVKVKKGDKEATVPEKEPVVIRFRDSVSPIIFIPHVIVIFLSMLLSTRTGLEYFSKEPNIKRLAQWTIGLLILGGFILGPLMQYYAFGALWTGFPFGYDLTDNKTLVALIAWLVVYFRLGKSKNPKRLALIGALVMFIVFLIPHSVLGSELDYNKIDQNKVGNSALPIEK